MKKKIVVLQYKRSVAKESMILREKNFTFCIFSCKKIFVNNNKDKVLTFRAIINIEMIENGLITQPIYNTYKILSTVIIFPFSLSKVSFL